MVEKKCSYFRGPKTELGKFKFGGNPDGTIEIHEDHLVFFKNNKLVKLTFGSIGTAIEGKGKLDFTIQIHQIVRLSHKEGDRYWIDLTDGNVLFVDFKGMSAMDVLKERPKTEPAMDALLARVGSGYAAAPQQPEPVYTAPQQQQPVYTAAPQQPEPVYTAAQQRQEPVYTAPQQPQYGAAPAQDGTYRYVPARHAASGAEAPASGAAARARTAPAAPQTPAHDYGQASYAPTGDPGYGYAAAPQTPYDAQPAASPSMGFGEAIKRCFARYATFTGRARRSEYWYFFLFNFVLAFVLTLIVPQLGSICVLALLLPSIAVGVRRLHDIGKAGGYYLLVLIPLVGAIILLVWFCRDGQPGENAYGPDPKGR